MPIRRFINYFGILGREKRESAATMRKKVPSDKYGAQRKLKSACASKQFGKCSVSAWRKDASSAIQKAHAQADLNLSWAHMYYDVWHL